MSSGGWEALITQFHYEILSIEMAAFTLSSQAVEVF